MKNAAFAYSFLLSAALTALAAAPGYCQLGGEGYHYSNGNARVVNQSARSYHMPGLTAISPGTISRSAQGVNVCGEQINPGLPTVRWGSTISTCGDQQYKTGFQTGHIRRIDVPDVAGTAIINTRLPGVNWGGNIGTAGDHIRSDMHPEVNVNNEAWWHPRPQVVQRGQAAPASYSGAYNPAAATYGSGGGSSGSLTY